MVVRTCPACRFSTDRKDVMDAHMRRHTGERPFVCDVPGCGASFTQRSLLTRHKFTHTGERRFPCPVPGCGYSGAEPASLRKHMSVHTGIKPFACNVPGCQYSAVQRSNVTRHKLKMHKGKRGSKSTLRRKAAPAAGPEEMALAIPEDEEMPAPLAIPEDDDDILSNLGLHEGSLPPHSPIRLPSSGHGPHLEYEPLSPGRAPLGYDLPFPAYEPPSPIRYNSAFSLGKGGYRTRRSHKRRRYRRNTVKS